MPAPSTWLRKARYFRGAGVAGQVPEISRIEVASNSGGLNWSGPRPGSSRGLPGGVPGGQTPVYHLPMPSAAPPRRMSRRAALEVLGLAAGATMARAGVAAGHQHTPSPSGRSRIASIDVFPVRYPMAGRFKFFEGPDGSPTGRPAALVRITDDAGVVGWGESVPIPKWSEETLETATTTLVRYLAPELVGRDCADIDGCACGHGPRDCALVLDRAAHRQGWHRPRAARSPR